MIKVPYEVAHFQYSGDTLKSQENLKAESSEDIWEAKTSQAVLRLSIDPASVVNEVRLGVVSSMTVTVVGEKAEGGEEVEIAREFPCEYEVGKQCSKFAIGNEQANIRFSAVRLVLQNTKDWLPMKVLYVSLYAQSPNFNATKRPSDTATRTPEKRYKVEQDPATCSYSSILFGCRVVTVRYSDHVKRLCECMGALYVSADFDRCTHCIVTADESSSEREHLKERNLQVVSVRWLEECLSARSRAQESAYVI